MGYTLDMTRITMLKLNGLQGLTEKFNCDMAMVKKIKNLHIAFHCEYKSLTQKKSRLFVSLFLILGLTLLRR